MKTTVWTLTTEGDNTGVETTVHATREAAEAVVRDGLIHAGLQNTPTANLEEVWAREYDGTCIIEPHTVEAARAPDPRVVAKMLEMLDYMQELIDMGELVIIDGSKADREEIFNRIGVLIAAAKGEVDPAMVEE